MKLDLPTSKLAVYKSPSQRARVATEAWGEDNLFCANCTSNELLPSATNTPTVDFVCGTCDAPFQLKSQSRTFSSRILDSAYAKMIQAIEEGKNPNLFVLHYEPTVWSVRNLILIPGFAFSRSAIERRKPLGPHARRAGWVGCNILLSKIPLDARIPIISDGMPSRPAEVRRQYATLRPLAELDVEARGWTLDVLRIVRSLDKRQFTLAEMYACESDLSRLHPRNRHVREKIRQQLQVLRDFGFLDFTGPGRYRLR